MEELSFFDLKTKGKFKASEYRVEKLRNRFFAVAKSPAGGHDCWRALSKELAEKLNAK